MDRSDYLKSIVGLGAAAAFMLGSPRFIAAQGSSGPAGTAYPDLVAVKNGKQEAMFDLAIAAAGGMARFVKKGSVVVVKPNIGWDVKPELAATTNPALVKRIVEHCFQAGAKKVYVFDNSCDAWKASYKNSQIEAFAREAGAEMAPAYAQSYYQKVTVPRATVLTAMSVHELILKADVFINVPVLKNHGGAGMTCALKNLMGIVWDRGFWHGNGLDRCIAEGALFRKPDLNIVDADRVMLSGGPRGSSASRYGEQKMLLLSADIVAIDSACAKVMGKEPSAFKYIEMASDAKLGIQNLESLNVKRITL